jgi:hypothetical protein
MTKPYTDYDKAFAIMSEAVDCTEVAPALLSHQQATSLKLLISDALNLMERMDTEPETFPNEYNWSQVGTGSLQGEIH